MREMAFLPHQDYILFQSTQHLDLDHNHHHHDFNHDHHPHHDSNSISLNMLSSCPPQDLQQGGRPMIPTLSMMNRSMSFPTFQQNEQDNNHNHNHEHEHEQKQEDGEGEDLSDDGSQVVAGGSGEKKKRLNIEQVRALEKTFEQGNKLEADRKVQLAKALGLQPRQVAIWFQNRRARWKTKQLEKDYSSLKRQFDVLKADHQSLLSHNNQLHAQLLSLRTSEGREYGAINLNNADTRSYWSNNGSEISSDINLGTSITPQTGSPLSSNPSNKIQFPTNSFIPNNITQLHQTSPIKPNLDQHCHKIHPNSIQDNDTFCNLFGGNHGGGGGDSGDHGGGVDQNQPPASFWAWPEQQHIN